VCKLKQKHGRNSADVNRGLWCQCYEKVEYLRGVLEVDEITGCPATHQIDADVGKVQKLVHADTVKCK
jgi:hypothetical protein